MQDQYVTLTLNMYVDWFTICLPVGSRSSYQFYGRHIYVFLRALTYVFIIKS